ncbi:unnamed protein product [Prorocentrum cordatum]|uniref:Uncharacterized protein n=1 Tax=Prorocentrum cordatum TaxID=2364126 RepID=A0ABN9WIG1_9DINO|nr:unnamed protein product [Polarella glacialis]
MGCVSQPTDGGELTEAPPELPHSDNIEAPSELLHDAFAEAHAVPLARAAEVAGQPAGLESGRRTAPELPEVAAGAAAAATAAASSRAPAGRRPARAALAAEVHAEQLQREASVAFRPSSRPPFRKYVVELGMSLQWKWLRVQRVPAHVLPDLSREPIHSRVSEEIFLMRVRRWVSPGCLPAPPPLPRPATRLSLSTDDIDACIAERIVAGTRLQW